MTRFLLAAFLALLPLTAEASAIKVNIATLSGQCHIYPQEGEVYSHHLPGHEGRKCWFNAKEVMPPESVHSGRSSQGIHEARALDTRPRSAHLPAGAVSQCNRSCQQLYYEYLGWLELEALKARAK